jgi:hypothetical protein
VLPRLLELRPFAFHICSELNFASIQRSHELRSATALVLGTTFEQLLSVRRAKSVVAHLPEGTVEIRDNRPLRLGSLELEPDVTVEEFLQEINSRVFLWPGNEKGPIGTGCAHFERYHGEGDVRVIRAPLKDLLRVNPDRALSVTYCNSGSARHHSGRKVLRGRSTFQPVEHATRPMSEVKELTFVGSVRLPKSVVWSPTPFGPWQAL